MAETASRAARAAVETVPLEQAWGRVLAAPVTAAEDVPGFARSTVDGYAVAAADTFGAGEGAPVLLVTTERVLMGQPASFGVQPGRAAPIPTGGMLPAGADAVVMVEHTLDSGEGLVEVTRPVAPGENVVRPGEDVARGAEILAAGQRLTAPDLGVLAAVGVTRVDCRPRPRVAIIPTGDEIVPATSPVGPGQVRDVTSTALAAYVRADGGEPTVFDVVPDQVPALEEAVGRAVEASTGPARPAAGSAAFDLVLILGGSSVGARDHTAAVIDRFGPAGVLIHGLALKPGKPTIYGLCGSGEVPVFGLPGHPVSSLVVYRLLVRPALRLLGGEAPPPWEAGPASSGPAGATANGPAGATMNGSARPTESAGPARSTGSREPVLAARLAVAVPSDQGRDEYLCVRLLWSAGTAPGVSGAPELLAEPVHGKSGHITTLARADGLVHIPAGVRGLEAGTMVEVIPLV